MLMNARIQNIHTLAIAHFLTTKAQCVCWVLSKFLSVALFRLSLSPSVLISISFSPHPYIRVVVLKQQRKTH